MSRPFQFSLRQFCTSVALVAVAMFLAKAHYDTILMGSTSPWLILRPIACCSSVGGAIGVLASPKSSGVKLGLLTGAIASSAILLPLFVWLRLMSYPLPG